MALTVQNGVLILRNGALGTGQSCCCVTPPPGGCCCVDGVFTNEYTTQADCTQCEDAYTCSEYTFAECQYADPDENGQCPPGFTPTWWGGCEQCGDCPEGFTPDGFGGCSRETTVADCDNCPGSCSYTETIGPCGTWSSTCQAAGCLFACCVCVRDYVKVECQVVEKVEGECPEGSQEAGERCFECDECPEGYTLSLGISQFGDDQTEGVHYCVSDESSVECNEKSSAACSGSGGFSVGPPKSDAGQSVCDSNPCAEFDCCQPDPCPPKCEESQWPEEIEVTLTGMPDGYTYICIGGCPRTDPPPGWGDDAVWRQVGPALGANITLASRHIQDCTIVMQRVSDGGCNGAAYAGVAVQESAVSFGGGDYQFGQENTGISDEAFVGLSISRDTRTGTFLTIETPEGGFGGGAEGIVVDYEDGAITGVRLCSGGNGYARLDGETVEVSVPNVVITSNTDGKGAEITAQIEDDPQSAIFGQVKSLTITNGGSGYGVGGYIIGVSGGGGGSIFLFRAANQIGDTVSFCGNEPGVTEDDNIDPGEIVSREICGTDLLEREYSVALRSNVAFGIGEGEVKNGFRFALIAPVCNEVYLINDIKIAVSISG
jgi:hypothetical protein